MCTEHFIALQQTTTTTSTNNNCEANITIISMRFFRSVKIVCETFRGIWEHSVPLWNFLTFDSKPFEVVTSHQRLQNLQHYVISDVFFSSLVLITNEWHFFNSMVLQLLAKPSSSVVIWISFVTEKKFRLQLNLHMHWVFCVKQEPFVGYSCWNHAHH